MSVATGIVTVRFRHLNYVHLVYLVAVAREGSVSAAAAALHVSPQTISGQLKTFGERLGGALTRRVGRGIELTPLGREVATKGARLLEQGEALLAGPVAERAAKPVLTVDGLRFKDANGNGRLDRYEDWRLPVGQRVADLVGQMTLEEKAGLMLIDTALVLCLQPAAATTTVSAAGPTYRWW